MRSCLINFMVYFSILSWMWPAPVEPFYGWELLKRNYSCITKASWLVLSDSLTHPMDHQMECGDCSRTIYAAPMYFLSATLVISEPPCDCIVPPTPVPFSPQEGVIQCQ